MVLARGIRALQGTCSSYPKIWTVSFSDRVMCQKDADRMETVKTLIRSSLIWVYTVCLDLSIQKLRIITVVEPSIDH